MSGGSDDLGFGLLKDLVTIFVVLIGVVFLSLIVVAFGIGYLAGH